MTTPNALPTPKEYEVAVHALEHLGIDIGQAAGDERIDSFFNTLLQAAKIDASDNIQIGEDHE